MQIKFKIDYYFSDRKYAILQLIMQAMIIALIAWKLRG